jgi:hypothetical protein
MAHRTTILKYASVANSARAGACLLLALVLGPALLIGRYVMAQNQAPVSSTAATKSTPRHDAWRAIPKALLPPPSDRRQITILNDRASYFDIGSLSKLPLDQPQPNRTFVSMGSYAPEDEFPFYPDEAIVVGHFEDYQPYLTPSRLSIYTDIELYVEQVLEPGPTEIVPGQVIDLLIDGGTVLLADGRTITYQAYDQTGDYSLQPEHRYLLFLMYYQKGDFFLDHKDWEFVNGVAVPNRLDVAIAAREGRCRYSGLSENAFIQVLEKALAKHQQKE